MLGRPGVAQVVAALGRSILDGRDVLGRVMSRVPVRKVSMMATGFRAVAVSGLPRGTASRVLDVGAGSGLLVYALHLAGMREVEGVDPFLGADVRYANGATVRKAGFEDVTDTYDVVMLNHSFEHVADPGRTLEQLKSRLAPGGRAVIRMPTVSSEAYETYGIDYYGLDAPRHLTIFSRSGMDRLCREHGFRVVRVADDSDSAQFWASEQIRRRIPLASPESHYLNPRGSAFSTRQAMRMGTASARAEPAGPGRPGGLGDRTGMTCFRREPPGTSCLLRGRRGREHRPRAGRTRPRDRVLRRERHDPQPVRRQCRVRRG